MDNQNIQPFTLKLDDSVNDHPNDNVSNAKLNYLYNDVKSVWMMKYGTTKILTHHMNSILVESWGAFKVSAVNIIRDSFVKKNYPPSVLPT